MARNIKQPPSEEILKALRAHPLNLMNHPLPPGLDEAIDEATGERDLPPGKTLAQLMDERRQYGLNIVKAMQSNIGALPTITGVTEKDVLDALDVMEKALTPTKT